jgi:hypothetical protein
MKIAAYLKSIDKFLLFFLTVFTIDKVVIKPLMIVVGLAGIWKYLSAKDLKKPPFFYIAIILLACLNLLFVNRDMSAPHLISFSIGIAYWVMCFCAFLVIKKRVEVNDLPTTERTLDTYFFINAAWSIGNLLLVMYKTHSLNPYMLEDEAYGTSTGDYIKGLLMGPSYLNMLVNSFFCVYYLYRKKYAWAALAVIIACMTTSNFANIILVVVLVLLVFLIRTKQAVLAVTLQLAVILFFYVFVSNSNLRYAIGSVNDVVKADQPHKIKVEGTPKVLEPTRVVTPTAKPFNVFKYRYGKLLSFEQTYDYLKASPQNMIMGAGIGAFSSQLAERTSDLPVPKKSRLFERLPKYMSQAFLDNHYKVFYAVYSLHPGYHSVRHFPKSFVNQILGEYGLIGLMLFLIFYLYFFIRNGRSLTYTWPMLVLLGYFFIFDYLFEYLSVVVFFELFFLIDLKRNAVTPQPGTL